MPNQGLGQLSNNLLFVTVLLYALAMLGYAAEFAFGRRQSRLHTAAAAPSRAAVSSRAAAPARATVRQAALVGAGGVPVPAGDADGPDAARWDASADPGTAAAASVPGSRAARREAERAAQGADLGPVAGVGKIAVLLTVAGWAAHVGSVVSRGYAAHRVPWGNMYEFSSMIALIAVTAFLVLLSRQPVRYLGAFVMLPVVLYLGLAGTVLYSAAGPLVPALNSYWIKIHVVAAMTSSGVFILAAVVTVLYLLKERWERLELAAVATGPTTAGGVSSATRQGGIMSRLPPAAALDRTAYRIVAFAFPIWTFAIIAGAIWAEAAWGRYWGWDPKETWSFITWVVYAGYLHARATAGWKGRRAASIALLGFACLAIDYYCVNIWISGLHSYAGI